MRFSEFLDMLNSKDVNASFYLEYTSMSTSTPQLMSDISPLPFASFLKTRVSNIWLSNGKTLGKLHYDPFENLLCQIGIYSLPFLSPFSLSLFTLSLSLSLSLSHSLIYLVAKRDQRK